MSQTTFYTVLNIDLSINFAKHKAKIHEGILTYEYLFTSMYFLYLSASEACQ